MYIIYIPIKTYINTNICVPIIFECFKVLVTRMAGIYPHFIAVNVLYSNYWPPKRSLHKCDKTTT